MKVFLHKIHVGTLFLSACMAMLHPPVYAQARSFNYYCLAWDHNHHIVYLSPIFRGKGSGDEDNYSDSANFSFQSYLVKTYKADFSGVGGGYCRFYSTYRQASEAKNGDEIANSTVNQHVSVLWEYAEPKEQK